MRRIVLCLIGLALPAVVVAEKAADKPTPMPDPGAIHWAGPPVVDPAAKPTLVLDAGGHTDAVLKVLFSPDGKELITVSDDKSIRFWDAATGEPLRTLRPPAGPGPQGMLYAAALSPDGKTLAVAGFGLYPGRCWVYLISPSGGDVRRVLKGHTSGINTVAFSPDGKRLASASWDKTARIWDVNTGESVFTLRGHAEGVRDLAWSPDGGRLATASFDKTARVWSAETGKEEAVLRGHDKEVQCVAWSPDGKTIATGGKDASVRLWGPDGTPRRTIDKLGVEVTSVHFSPDSRRLLYTGGFGPTARRVAVLDLGGDGRVAFGRHTDTVRWGVFSPDGALAATADGAGTIYLWKTADGSVVRQLAGGGRIVRAAAWAEAKDGQTLLWGATDKGDYLKATGPLEHSFVLPELRLDAAGNQPVRRATLSAGSSAVEVSDDRLTLTLKRGDDKVAQRHGKVGERVLCYTFLPNDRIAVGADYGLYLLDARTLKPLRTFVGHTGAVWAVAPSPDGRYLLSASADQTLRVWALDELNHKEWVGLGIHLKVLDGAPTVVGIVPGGPAERDGRLKLKDRIVAVEDADGKFVDVGGVASITDLTPLLRGREGTTARVKVLSADKTEPVVYEIKRARVEEAVPRTEPLLSLFFAGKDWIAWTPEGYYAASPGGERLMGWQVDNGPEAMASYYPASQFRKTLYRPDVIKRLLTAGSVEKALAEADAERGTRSQATEVAQVLPPKVKITAPKGNSLRLDKPALHVIADTTDAAGNPVASVRLLLDGRPYDGVKKAPVLLPGVPGVAEAAWDVELPPGGHRLTVEAAGRASVGLSDELEVTYTPAGQAPDKAGAAAGNLYVLAVGINDYPAALRLQCAAPDARLIAQTFKDEAKGLFRKVEVKLLTDKEATRDGILKGLQWLRDNARPGDVAVAFYAGHGDCRLAGRFFLIPVDANLKDLPASAVSGDELKAKLSDLPCSTVLVLDACYSGSIDATRKTRALPGAADALVRDFTYDAGLVVLCGAAKEQEAAEEQGHGFFTRALAEGLSGKARKDAQGLVTLLKLQDYVHDRVAELSGGEQEPTISIPSTVRSFPLAKP